MKRLKRKVFKRQSDLIKHAVRRAIHHQDVEIPARVTAGAEKYLKEHPPDFLHEAEMKLRRLR